MTNRAHGVTFPERLLTPEEVADILGLSRDWVRRHAAPAVRKPELKCVRIGSEQRAELRFRVSDVQEFIQQNLRGGEK